jgi:hypothetical protein
VARAGELGGWGGDPRTVGVTVLRPAVAAAGAAWGWVRRRSSAEAAARLAGGGAALRA